jgi:hypothetical protein
LGYPARYSGIHADNAQFDLIAPILPILCARYRDMSQIVRGGLQVKLQSLADEIKAFGSQPFGFGSDARKEEEE